MPITEILGTGKLETSLIALPNIFIFTLQKWWVCGDDDRKHLIESNSFS
jgi:hypothetical protein